MAPSVKPVQTVRQQIIELLTNGEMDARELSQEARIKEKEVIEHLSHIARTLAIQGKKLAIRPAECLLCGYVFEKRQRFTRPGRCPRCKKSHLQRPVFFISHRV
jgi:hypothetical protein